MKSTATTESVVVPALESGSIVPGLRTLRSCGAAVITVARIAAMRATITYRYYARTVTDRDFLEQREPAIPVRDEFLRLAVDLDTETRFISDVDKIIHHSAYQQIIGLGHEVVPFLLLDLDQHPGRWLWALHSITGANPVPSSALGNVKKMASAWSEWGKHNGII